MPEYRITSAVHDNCPTQGESHPLTEPCPLRPNLRPCFWDECTTLTSQTIYWDGVDEPCCQAHQPEAKQAVWEILASIDERMMG